MKTEVEDSGTCSGKWGPTFWDQLLCKRPARSLRTCFFIVRPHFVASSNWHRLSQAEWNTWRVSTRGGQRIDACSISDTQKDAWKSDKKKWSSWVIMNANESNFVECSIPVISTPGSFRLFWCCGPVDATICNRRLQQCGWNGNTLFVSVIWLVE